ncbi:alcohol dehydrogenase [Aphelenchoides besseyi]|nr:alcohol dehydrogenase [Aphelenchoides besseyi]KAI6195893.1 alcohol dehydrogenase [Aphelenchoides besseyi]KAI6224011.1 alcohol dehydrogenase [Aphelenchoides besseyi]
MATTITLSNGVKMPIFGLGTWQANEGEVAAALRVALENGYRLIDTATAYQNEAEIGAVLQEFFKAGKLKREDVFITTKLFWNSNREEDVEPSIRQSLKALQLDYIDLYLIHTPAGLMKDMSKVDNSVKLEDVWRGMEKIYDKKLARAIGVSNANAEQLERVQKSARIPIHNNQVECHLLFNQEALLKVQKRLNISMTAYAPIGSPARKDVDFQNGLGFFFKDKHPSPLENSLVKKLAEKHSKTPAQILLRHLVQRGICVIPKSTNEKRLKENADIFNFSLSDDEIRQLNSVPQESRFFWLEFMEGSNEDSFKDERKKH